jgi:myo-inositol-1(or 4)-monophosphatase
MEPELEYDPVLLDELHELAVSAAREAGAMVLEARRGRIDVAGTKSSATDVVTEVDRRSEALLVDRLLSARNDDGILGEEGADHVGETGVRWVLDPIDGTVNFLYDLPHWAVSVAAEVDGVVVVGVVEAPALGQTYVAVRGRGAKMHDRYGVHELRANDPVPIESALVGTGFGYRADRRASQARVVAAMLPEVRDIRRLGACALDLCAVGSGRLDAYFERGVNAWDHAAGGLVALEAGAVVGGLHGAPAGEDMLLAAGPALFEALEPRLVALRADSDE